MFTHISKRPLPPVGAAQTGLTMQASALFVQVILPAGVGRVIDQQALVVLAGKIDAVLQRAGSERHIAVNQLGSLLCKGILCLLQGGSLSAPSARRLSGISNHQAAQKLASLTAQRGQRG